MAEDRRDSLTNPTDESTIEHNEQDHTMNAHAVATRDIVIYAPPMRLLALRKAVVRFARWAGWLIDLDPKEKELVDLFLKWEPRQSHPPSR